MKPIIRPNAIFTSLSQIKACWDRKADTLADRHSGMRHLYQAVEQSRTWPRLHAGIRFADVEEYKNGLTRLRDVVPWAQQEPFEDVAQ